MKEQAEIERILLALSAMVEEVAPDLFNLVKVLGEIDVILAKGKYGQANKCTMPKMNNDGYIRLVRARHPLYQLKQRFLTILNLGKTLRQL